VDETAKQNAKPDWKLSKVNNIVTPKTIFHSPAPSVKKFKETSAKRALLRDDSSLAAVTPSPGVRTKHTQLRADHASLAFRDKVRRKLITPINEISIENEETSKLLSTSVSVSLDERDYLTPEEDPDDKSSIFSGSKGRKFESKTLLQDNVKTVYSIIKTRTGTIGGNGCGGAIYGETTAVSLQRVINLLKEHTGFDHTSRFIDVGCGLGKPNLHVAQDPGVAFSYGIEMEEVRLMLGLHNLRFVLDHAKVQQDALRSGKILDTETILGYNCAFEFGNIIQAKSFDPFTHVYMFDIGFPPSLFHQLAEMFNISQSPYLISYQGPGRIIDCYNFDVVLLARTPISMHGSKEHHTGYIYKRRNFTSQPDSMLCDPLFRKAWDDVKAGLEHLHQVVSESFKEKSSPLRPKRTIKPTFKLTP